MIKFVFKFISHQNKSYFRILTFSEPLVEVYKIICYKNSRSYVLFYFHRMTDKLILVIALINLN